MRMITTRDARIPRGLALSRGDARITAFQPAMAGVRDAQADAVIEYAKRVHDWSLLEAAIDQKIEDQRQFVAWWDGSVTPNRAPDRNNRSVISVRDAEAQTSITVMQVSRWRKSLNDPDAYRAKLRGAVWAKAMALSKEASQLVQQSLSAEHYTPQQYIEAARAVLGGIDLDPASREEANATVKAKRFFTAAQNGLELEWSGRVWLNPPYGGAAAEFVAKLWREYGDGNVSAAVVLVNAHCTDTAWFQPLWNGVLCFTDHRINFYGDDSRSGSTHGSVFTYFGQRKNDFVREFGQFGACVERCSVVDK